VTAAAERKLAAAHLVAQVDDFLARLGSFDRVFVHGDLSRCMRSVDERPPEGVIDWADAIVTDRHYELAQVYRDTSSATGRCCAVPRCERLAGRSRLPRRTLGHALRRQGMMLVQHRAGVFEPIASGSRWTTSRRWRARRRILRV